MEERVSEIKDRSVKIIHLRGKRKISEDGLRDYVTPSDRTIHAYRCHRKRRQRGRELFKEMITENFPNQGK